MRDGYPAFGEDPALWGLEPEEPMTEAEAAAAEELELWGPGGPPTAEQWRAELASYRQAEAG